MYINPIYGSLDADSEITLKHFQLNESAPRLICEVGANEEHIADILTDNGHTVIGVDLRDISLIDKQPKYIRIKDDFVTLAKTLNTCFDVMISTSAIEHFGLCVYGQTERIEDYDAQAMRAMYDLLKPGGTCYITVPYCGKFREERDWRVYDEATLQERIIGKFEVVEKIFFKSGGCICPDVNNIVSKEDADKFSGDPPHVTAFLLMRKPANG